MSILAARLHQSYPFSFSINQEKYSSSIVLTVDGDMVRTHTFPQTFFILQKHLPSILESKCFNYRNYSFAKEVKNTELGHLFEHILLEYLSCEKMKQEHVRAVFSGLTKWDWEKEARGVFHIFIDVGVEDTAIFTLSFNRTVYLFDRILKSAQEQQKALEESQEKQTILMR